MQNLGFILDGWDGYQLSLVHALTPLTHEQLAWRPTPKQRSVGEIFRHLSLGRITWLSRISAPRIEEVAAAVPQWFTDGDGSRHVVEDAVACDQAERLAEWLSLSWLPIQAALNKWNVQDLSQTYPHRFRGTDYLISRQWVLWRIMSHDIHHGGQLAMMLGMQNVDALELRALGGHVTVPQRRQ